MNPANPLKALAILALMALTADVFFRKEQSLALSFAKGAGWR